MSREMMERVLVAGVGNVLRGDDGFGVAVAQRLLADAALPPHVDVVETGIGGMSIVHTLMNGYQALIIVDAVERGAQPGTVFVLEPEVLDAKAMPPAAWQALFSNLHLAEPSRIFALAGALGILPRRVLLVGCQPQECEELCETLSRPVQAAVEVAACKVRTLLVADLCA